MKLLQRFRLWNLRSQVRIAGELLRAAGKEEKEAHARLQQARFRLSEYMRELRL